MEKINIIYENRNSIFEWINLVLNFLGIFIPLIVLFVTLHIEKNNNKKALKNQKQLFDAEQRLEKTRHEESLAAEREEIRANMMPFLKLDNYSLSEVKNNKYIFKIGFTNVGNGAAFDIVTIPAHEKKDENNYSFTYEFYDLSDYVLPVESKCSFNFEATVCNENGETIHADTYSPCFEMYLYYKDALYLEYRQKFLFKYVIINGFYEIKSFLPEKILHTDSGVN